MNQKLVRGEKRNRVDWAVDTQKLYEREKTMEKSRTHIFLQKENEFKQVQRSIRKFSAEHNMEFDTIFKMYKIQEYPLTTGLFIGTSYKYGTLASIRNWVRVATAGTCNYSSEHIYNVIYAFISEIKSCSKPFPYIFGEDRRCSAMKLLESGTLTKDEEEFLRSRINARRPESSEEERNTSSTTLKNRKRRNEMKKQKVETRKNVRTTMTEQDRLSVYKLIANNYHLGYDVVKGLVTAIASMAEPTIKNYINACKHLEKQENVADTTPKMLIYMWKQRKPSESPVKTTIQDENIAEKIAKSKANSIINKIKSENTGSRFILISANNDILTSSTSLDYLKGFRDAASNSSELKICQLTELVEA